MTDPTHLSSEQSYSLPLATARHVRMRFIDLTYELPKDPSPDVLHLWNLADTALVEFIRALEQAEDLTRI